MSDADLDTAIQQDGDRPDPPFAVARQYWFGRLLIHEGVQPDDGAWLAGPPVEVTE